MRNVLGLPVLGQDFFDRVEFVASLWSLLEADNVLLLAPRRVGKTSVLYRLRDEAPTHQRQAVYLSLAGLVTELEVVQALVDAMCKVDLGRQLVERVAQGPAGRFLKRIEGMGLAGVSFEIAPAAQPEWRELGQVLLSSAHDTEVSWLLLVDELPVFILHLLRQDPSGMRSRQFLEWFRALRSQTLSLRWVLAGSIGLDTVVSRLGVTNTIADLVAHKDLGALDRLDALGMLETLSTQYQVPLDPDVPDFVCDWLGWTVPHHLQLAFAELRSSYRPGAPPIDRTQAQRCLDELLAPTKRMYFEPWYQRLREQLGPPDDKRAVALLDLAAQESTGASLDSLRSLLVTQMSDADERAERLSFLLRVLQNDGYLVSEDGAYRFRSPLLRAYWKSRRLP